MELKCKLTAITPFSVTVANGSKMYSHKRCEGFCWEMQGHAFQADLRVLELSDCDTMLGVDCMKTINPLTFDFNKLEVTVERGNFKLILKGTMEQGECKWIRGKKLGLWSKENANG